MSSSSASSARVLPVLGSTCEWYPACEAKDGDKARVSWMNSSLRRANLAEASEDEAGVCAAKALLRRAQATRTIDRISSSHFRNFKPLRNPQRHQKPSQDHGRMSQVGWRCPDKCTPRTST